MTREIAHAQETKMEKAQGGRRQKHVPSNAPGGNDTENSYQRESWTLTYRATILCIWMTTAYSIFSGLATFC